MLMDYFFFKKFYPILKLILSFEKFIQTLI